MSDFLGGILSNRQQVNPSEVALRRELEARRYRWDRPGYHYRGAGDILLRHGRFFAGRIMPAEFEPLRGRPNGCFQNALDACEQDDRLEYWEGVYSCGLGHFTHHAWCVFGGELVEVTVPTTGLENFIRREGFKIMPVETWGYWGVRWTRELVRDFADKFELPLLDRAKADVTYSDFPDPEATSNHHDAPILRHVYDPNRKELP